MIVSSNVLLYFDQVAANEDNVDLLLQMEAFKLDLESRDTQITGT